MKLKYILLIALAALAFSLAPLWGVVPEIASGNSRANGGDVHSIAAGNGGASGGDVYHIAGSKIGIGSGSN